MFYIVYLTKNLLNGKIYVGAHATSNLNDGYIGSGVYLLDAIKSYGRENFSRIVLYTCKNADDMYEVERLLVDENFVQSPMTYNIQVGGRQLYMSLPISKLDLSRRNSGKRNPFYGRKHTEEAKIKIKNARAKQVVTEETKEKLRIRNGGKNHPLYGKSMSAETKAKISAARKAYLLRSK